MKQETKYYTPDIEEFHVGFECEAKVIEIGWQHSVMSAVPEYVKDYLNKGVYRVKYLDREDIEGLGWEYVKTVNQIGIGNIFIFKYNDYILNFIPSDKGRIVIKDGGLNIDLIIKNKSELKRLMKQIKYRNITERVAKRIRKKTRVQAKQVAKISNKSVDQIFEMMYEQNKRNYVKGLYSI